MVRSVVVGLALVIGATAALAQGDPIAQRREIMKGVGAATRTATQMSRGEIPFDLGKAKEVLQVYANAADKTHQYFPDTSKTGGETAASPKIWENQADFRKQFDDWAANIRKASANTKDLETFRAEFQTLSRSCGSCHQSYRINRS